MEQVTVTDRELLFAANVGYVQRTCLELPQTWDEALEQKSSGDWFGRALAIELCAMSTVGDGQHDLDLAIRTAEGFIEDLQNVLERLQVLRAKIVKPPWYHMDWHPVVDGPNHARRVVLEDQVSQGWVRPHIGKWLVVQLGFPSQLVDTPEAGYEVLLEREYARWKSKRAREKAQAEKVGAPC
jgi:hypothetical protein